MEEEAELVNWGRVMAFLHMCLHNGYDVDIVLRFLDPSFNKIDAKYWTTATTIVFLLKVVVLFSGATLSPYFYANYVMDYPCKPSDQILGDGHDNKQVTLSGVGCEAQDIVRSKWVLAAVPCAFAVSLAAFGMKWLVDLVASFCKPAASYGPGEYILAMCKKYLLSVTAKQLARVKYTNSLYYNMSCGMYFIMLAEFAVISAIMKSAVSALVGYAISQLFLTMASYGLAPSQDYIVKVQGTLASWPEEDDAARGVLHRLAMQPGGDTIYATRAELKSFAKLEQLCKAIAGDIDTLENYCKQFDRQAKSNPQAKRRFGFFKLTTGWHFRDIRLSAWGLLSATKIYVVGSDIVIDSVEGKVIYPGQVDSDDDECQLFCSSSDDDE